MHGISQRSVRTLRRKANFACLVWIGCTLKHENKAPGACMLRFAVAEPSSPSIPFLSSTRPAIPMLCVNLPCRCANSSPKNGQQPRFNSTRYAKPLRKETAEKREIMGQVGWKENHFIVKKSDPLGAICSVIVMVSLIPATERSPFPVFPLHSAFPRPPRSSSVVCCCR